MLPTPSPQRPSISLLDFLSLLLPSDLGCLSAIEKKEKKTTTNRKKKCYIVNRSRDLQNYHRRFRYPHSSSPIRTPTPTPPRHAPLIFVSNFVSHLNIVSKDQCHRHFRRCKFLISFSRSASPLSPHPPSRRAKSLSKPNTPDLFPSSPRPPFLFRGLRFLVLLPNDSLFSHPHCIPIIRRKKILSRRTTIELYTIILPRTPFKKFRFFCVPRHLLAFLSLIVGHHCYLTFVLEHDSPQYPTASCERIICIYNL